MSTGTRVFRVEPETVEVEVRQYAEDVPFGTLEISCNGFVVTFFADGPDAGEQLRNQLVTALALAETKIV